MITGSNSGALKDVEVIRINDEESSSSTCTLPTYPLSVSYASGVILNEALVVCGGNNGANKYFKWQEGKGWSAMPSMSANRYGHAMVSIGNTMYAVGGVWFNTAESYKDGSWSNMQNLPFRSLGYSCLVQIDAKTIMTIGGYDGYVVSE